MIAKDLQCFRPSNNIRVLYNRFIADNRKGSNKRSRTGRCLEDGEELLIQHRDYDDGGGDSVAHHQNPSVVSPMQFQNDYPGYSLGSTTESVLTRSRQQDSAKRFRHNTTADRASLAISEILREVRGAHLSQEESEKILQEALWGFSHIPGVSGVFAQQVTTEMAKMLDHRDDILCSRTALTSILSSSSVDQLRRFLDCFHDRIAISCPTLSRSLLLALLSKRDITRLTRAYGADGVERAAAGKRLNPSDATNNAKNPSSRFQHAGRKSAEEMLSI